MADPLHQRLQDAIRSPKRGDIAVMPYLTAGFPDRKGFGELLARVAEHADAIELGVPFSDPMADGVTIQDASEVALAQGTSLRWILSMLGGQPEPLRAPVVLMSYLNPLLAYGLRQLVRDAAEVGVAGFIVPDLPYEESEELRRLCDEAGLALIPLVTPLTPPERLRRLVRDSRGFVYAVTRTGITGGSTDVAAIQGWLDGVRAASAAPVCAGFGIREASQLTALSGHADGAIVGTALIQVLADGGDAVGFVKGLVGA